MLPDDSIERWEQLESYLAGRMDKNQEQQLQEQMKIDKQLVAEINLVRRAHQILDSAFIEQQMRDTLRKIRTEQRNVTKSPKSNYPWRRIGIWVAAASLILTGYLSLSPVTLPDAGYNVMALRHIDTTTLSAEQRLAFESFFEGQAHMVEGDYVQAALHFENVLTVDDLRPYFKEAAEWHLAVSYLKSSQINRADYLYQQLQNCEHCTYKVGWLNHLKMKWQLFMAKWRP